MATISSFYEHEIQSVLALFLTKPKLFKDYNSMKDKQGYFFEKFRNFANDYYHFSVDENVYFMSTRKEAAGEANICGGGGGKRSGTSSRYFKSRYHQFEELRHKQIEQFAKKYRVSFECGNDPRMFLGVTEIWNKLDRANEIVAESKWANVAEIAYEDASFETPIPMNLDKNLIPFSIRNRTMQKLHNMKKNAYVIHVCRIKNPIYDDGEEEENDIQRESKENSPVITSKSTNIVVMPSACELDEDW